MSILSPDITTSPIPKGAITLTCNILLHEEGSTQGNYWVGKEVSL